VFVNESRTKTPTKMEIPELPPQRSIQPDSSLPIEKLTLEVRKLRQDIRFGKITIGLSMLGTCLLLAGIALDRMKVHAQREREISLALYTQRREAYLALIESASAIAACSSYNEVREAAKKFKIVARGRAHLEGKPDATVMDAKRKFHNLLEEYLRTNSGETPEYLFAPAVMELNIACQQFTNPLSFDQAAKEMAKKAE
jgi:hypothetical protein